MVTMVTMVTNMTGIGVLFLNILDPIGSAFLLDFRALELAQ
jgi:hypothetical protein